MQVKHSLAAVAVSAVLLTGCQANSVASQPKAPASPNYPAVAIPYQSFTLANGLTLVVHEDHKAPIVAVNIWYGVGSKDEKPGKTGFAHLFEHLMFNGSENFNDEYFGPFEKAGATDMNGTTNNDRTNYFENVPTPALDMALWMESDRMGHLVGAIDQAKLDEQRGVVQNEKRQGEAQPFGRVFGYLAEQTFPKGHPYSWTTIGSMADLNAASLADVKDWFKNYYGAANAVIVLAGDITPEQAKAKVEHYFGDIPAGPPLKKAKAWVAKMQGTKRATMQDKVPNDRLYMVWNVPQYGTQEAQQLDLLSDVLTGGKSSRLFQRLVDKDQLATNIYAFNYSRQLAGQLIIMADAKPGVSLAKLEKAIDEELARLAQDGPSSDELNRVKFSQVAGMVRATERVGGFGGKSDFLAQGTVYEGNPGFYQTQLKDLESTTPADIQKLVKDWLSDGVFVLDVSPQPDFKTASNGADRSKLPVVGKLPALTLPALHSFTLSNGLKVALAERHDTSTVEMMLRFGGGYASDYGHTTGTASFAMAMLHEGTDSLSGPQLADAMSELGSSWSSNASLDMSYVSLDSLTVNLDPSLVLLSDILEHPAFRQADMDKRRSRWIDNIQQEKAQPVNMALRVLPELLYGGHHAYSAPLTGSGTKASIEALTRADLKRYHQDWLRPDNARLVVVGDTTEAELKPLLEKRLAGWQAPATAKPAINLAQVAPQQQSRVFLIDQPGSPQATIIAGQLAPSKSSDQADAIEVMNGILGGTFTSRLNMNLREDKHWSYGAGSFWVKAKGQGIYAAYAPVQVDKTKESIEEIEKELHGFVGKHPATAAELAKLQANKTAELPGAYETKSALASSIGKTLDSGKDMTWLAGYSDRIKALKLKDVQQAATLIQPQALTWVIVGDLSKMEAQVRSLKLGPVTKLDSDGNPL
ncbi:MAG: pitrilysin family protein [Pseudomonadota bacterium]|uniref:M16 family metallopeptidase n=1 Tax=Gallaecimonas pentaromativorans TaxID=584787 RepID=UPI00067EE859|nr:pitrilysin family protein [Gallaecimonas pentaromativorans]MED5526188.1 pitrilysin family protein [Pseudomonadota bacterium]